MNLLLQHWKGGLGELETASMYAMQQYAMAHDAAYELVEGEPLGAGFAAQMHKLYALSPRFDQYDTVVVTDMDMFPRPGAPSVFNAPGIGVMTATQEALRRSLHGWYPGIADQKADYYGGAVYRFTREVRVKLQPFLTAALRPEFVARFQDEGAMHFLASQAGLKGHALPDGERWAMSSYDPNVENAFFIHIRTKTTPVGPKALKLDNYKRFVRQGLIAA